MPTGALYGTKKACQPQSLIYNYFDRKIYVSNDSRQSMDNFEAEISLYNLNSEKIFGKTEKISVEENGSRVLSDLPEPKVKKGSNEVFFLDLKLKNSAGELVADNFYWLATKTDQMAWDKYVWYYTPQKEFADFTKLNSLPRVTPEITREQRIEGPEGIITLTISNPGKTISFFNEVVLERKFSHEPVLPQFLSDNYITLLPGESKKIVVRYHQKDLNGEKPAVMIQGINLPGKIVL
jgi:exo-1,4-beta-D-glucosaminidase